MQKEFTILLVLLVVLEKQGLGIYHENIKVCLYLLHRGIGLNPI